MVRLEDGKTPAGAGAIEFTTSRAGDSAVVTVVGAVDRAGALTLATHLAELASSGSDRLVVDAAGAYSAARITEALSTASLVLETNGARLALVPPPRELLSASVMLTATGMGGRVGVFDSVADATRGVNATGAGH